MWTQQLQVCGFGAQTHHDDVLAEETLDTPRPVADGEAGAIGYEGPRLGGVVAAVGNWAQGEGASKGVREVVMAGLAEGLCSPRLHRTMNPP